MPDGPGTVTVTVSELRVACFSPTIQLLSISRKFTAEDID